MPGWPGSSRPSSSSGTAMTWWSTAARWRWPTGFGKRSRIDWPSAAACSCTRSRPALSTARTHAGVARSSTPRSPSWAMSSASERSGRRPADTCSASTRRSARTRANASAGEIRSWRLHHRSGSTLEQLAVEVNPVTRGWLNYYGAYRPSELQYTLHRIDHYLMRWLLQKYKRFHGSQRRAWAGLHKAALDRPTLFAHWRIVHP